MTNDANDLMRRAARALRIAAAYNLLHDDDQAEFAAAWQALAADLDAAAQTGPAPGPLLDLAEAAAYLRRGTSTLRRDVASGTLRAFRPAGGAALIFRRDDLDAFLQPVQVALPKQQERDVPPARARAVAEKPAGYTTEENEE